jgi:3-methyladenine DNA glycosylase/8-oxoguanine DNA glycosylase
MRSHGWFDLIPFGLSQNRSELRYAAPSGGRNARETLRANWEHLLVYVHSGTKAAAEYLAFHLLGLKRDIACFQREFASEHDLSSIIEGNHGSLLRSATLFEDLLKALFTINTPWDRTRRTNDELVKQFGSNRESCSVFPQPGNLVDVGEQAHQTLIGCRSRAKSVLKIAKRALKYPDTFLGQAWTALCPSDFRSLVLGCHGIGPVSANYLSSVYGRCAGFAVDAYVRRRLREFGGNRKQWRTNDSGSFRRAMAAKRL